MKRGIAWAVGSVAAVPLLDGYDSGVMTLFLQMFFGIKPRDLAPSFAFESLLFRPTL
jgi:hypothetical protein